MSRVQIPPGPFWDLDTLGKESLFAASTQGVGPNPSGASFLSFKWGRGLSGGSSLQIGI